jgi:hypothetical protein
VFLQRSPREWPRDRVRAAASGVGVTLVLLIVALLALRAVQRRTVSSLAARYGAAATEDVPVTRAGVSTLDVGWQPADYGQSPWHRSSDLLVLTVDASRCGSAPEVDVRIRYDADVPSRDLSSTMTVQRPRDGSGQTQLYVPIFLEGLDKHTYLRFAGIDVGGAPAECISRVARVVDPTALPLWLAMQVPPDWHARRLYQSIRPPRAFRSWHSGPLL